MPYNDPWFDPNSPNATWGPGVGSVMQGMYGNAMLQKQIAEEARRFDVESGFKNRVQDWAETNTPAFQFGQMADVTREKLGPDVDPTRIQENYFGNFKPNEPRQPQTIFEQASEMFKNGGASSLAEAYDKVLKTGKESPNMIRATYGSGGQPNWRTVQFEDAKRRYEKGEFGTPGTPDAQARFERHVQSLASNRPPSLLPEQKALVQSAIPALSQEIARLDKEMVAIEHRDDVMGRDKRTQAMEGPFWNRRNAGWPQMWADRHDLLTKQMTQLKAALQFVQRLDDDTLGGYQMSPALIQWLNALVGRVQSIYDDPSMMSRMTGLEPVRTPVDQYGPTGSAPFQQ